ncbi:hypothetical protein ACJ6WF_34525 [Streptomyces sp. MMS24-I2-30]|uniref:hypothetical protein n=1 Tax=Streptomyces sp. MMS24-I2-30 TaxID=3351564 RepID=UPI003896CD01
MADFYGAYIGAVCDGTDDLSSQLRSLFLTEDLQQRLAAWEEVNHADGVLRAQDVPTRAPVHQGHADRGHRP